MTMQTKALSLSQRIVRCLFLLAVVAGLPAGAMEITSPDGNVSAEVGLDQGGLWYRVVLNGETMVARSPLGLVTTGADFSQGLTLVSEKGSVDVRIEYDLPLGKCSSVSRVMRHAELTVADAKGKKLDLLVRVGDDGVALAYRPHDAAPDERVDREATAFALPEGSTGFLHPMAKAKSPWARTQPSYEELYSIDEPVGTPSPLGQGWCFPALFRVGDVGWVLVSETGVDGHYCGMHLAQESPGGVYRMALPQQEENIGTDEARPLLAAGRATPWRTIVVGKTLAPIVESTLATDLVEPLFECPTPQPGRAAWSWLKLKDGNTIENVQREFIDMAADLGWEYVLIDAQWDQQIGREKIAELVEYAKSKGVGILLWYNSNGSWNDAYQTPRDRMHTAEVREEEMAWLEKTGVKGVKVDFFGGDKQAVMELYEAILRDAARFGLSVNFHGTTLPRGWSRMYPSYATNEAVRGMEFATFEQPNADAQPVHCTVLPFTRNAVGPMDFTPVIVDERLGVSGDGPHRRTRLSYELALPVLFHSPVTHFGLTPGDRKLLPPAAEDYLRKVPTVWDETRYVAGYPGKYAAIARRKGDRWWLAAVNGQEEEVTFKLPEALAGAAWSVIRDDGFNQVAGDTRPAGDGEIVLPAHGGVVMWTGGE